jgi:hypothetical protein
VSEFPVQVTIKPPATVASAPWLNFQGQSPDEVKDAILEVFPGIEHDSFAELVAKAYAEYGAVVTAVVGLAAPAAPQAASIQSSGPAPQWAGPVAAAAQSGPPAPQCPHGEKVYREGVGAKGPWKAWFCPSPRMTRQSVTPRSPARWPVRG